MKVNFSCVKAAAFVGLLAAPMGAFATNGSFMIGFGAGSIGMGGVGVTSPQDSTCAGANPACLGEFVSPQFDMGVGFFDPRRRSGTIAIAGAEGNSWSGVNTYLMPAMGFVFPFNDELTIGFAALAAGGGGSTFSPNFFGVNNGNLGVELLQLIVPITVSYKLDKTNTIGISAVPARQRFLAQGIQNFEGMSSDPDHLSNKGHDYANGFGVRLGWNGKFLDNRVTLGATYGSKISMSKFRLYSGLFPNAGSMDIPENYAIGIGFKPVEQLTLALDIQQINYSDVPGFGHKGPDDTGALNIDTCTTVAGVRTCAGPTSLGLPGGAGFGWVDQTVYKLGVAYKNAFPSWFGEDKLTLRAGYNYGKAPINKKQLLFSLLAPATTEKHITLGLTYSLGDQSIFGFGSEGLVTVAYMHAVKNKIEGITTGTGGLPGMASMEMFQNSLDIAYTLKF